MYGNWKLLIKGLLIKERVKKRFNLKVGVLLSYYPPLQWRYVNRHAPVIYVVFNLIMFSVHILDAWVSALISLMLTARGDQIHFVLLFTLVNSWTMGSFHRLGMTLRIICPQWCCMVLNGTIIFNPKSPRWTLLYQELSFKISVHLPTWSHSELVFIPGGSQFTHMDSQTNRSDSNLQLSTF